MEFEYFESIRKYLCLANSEVKPGKMMRSEAIMYKGKVFAFLSTKKKMVFKLGFNYKNTNDKLDIAEFNPFKKKGPLRGWFEVPFSNKEYWEILSKEALSKMEAK